MAHDQETYRRGWSAALIGLIVQIVLTLVVAFLGLWTENAAISTATWHVLGGVAIWIVLMMLYNQHRLERVESLEAEQISTKDKQAAAIFAEHADDLDLARRRLDMLYKYWLNGVSAAVAIYLIVMGGLFFFKHYNMVKGAKSFATSELVTNALAEGVNPMIVMFSAAAITFLMFIVARYLSGMTKVREWTLLRGGAAYVMGNFGVMLLIVIGALLKYFESDTLLGLIALATPAIMILVGIEILVTFLLSAYRPRRPGEIPRPAFDSRVLGMLTSPDSLGRIISETLNYQFGFEISRSWFYQLLGRAVTPLTAGGLAILLVMSMIVTVPPHQQAIITFNGDRDRIADSGITWKMPWPLGGVEYYAVGEVHQAWVGSSRAKIDNTAILWTNQHEESTENKQYLITAPSHDLSANHDDSGIKAGLSLLAGEVVVNFRIDDLWQFVNGAENPNELVTALADRRVNAYFASNNLDTLLGTGRGPAGEQLRQQIQKDTDAMDLGISILFVGITGAHPPSDKEVAKSFHDVIGALSKKEAAIEEAEKNAIAALASVAGTRQQAVDIDAAIVELEGLKERSANEAEIREKEAEIVKLLADASGEAAKLIFEARAYRWQRGVTEGAAARRFAFQQEAYQKARDYYRAKQYMETLATGLADSRKYVMTADQTDAAEFRIDLHDIRSELGGLFDDDE